MQSITLTTSDGVSIAGNYMPVQDAKHAAILLHMMPATKESWNNFQTELAKNNIASLAIDLRGHGQSTQQGDTVLNFKEFGDNDHKKYAQDVDTAANFLKQQGFTTNQIIPIGASIGANLSLQFLSENPDSPKAVLLSPGLNYHGVITDEAVKKLTSDQFVLILTSQDDEESFLDSQKLYHLNPDQITMHIFTDLGHGTHMLEKHTALGNEIIDWLVE